MLLKGILRYLARIVKAKPKRPEPVVPTCYGCKLPLDPYYAVAIRGHRFHDVSCWFDVPAVFRKGVTL